MRKNNNGYLDRWNSEDLYSEIAEKAVLTCLLIDKETNKEYVPKIDLNFFYVKINRIIFGIILDFHKDNICADIVSVTEKIQSNDQYNHNNTLDEVDTVLYISDLVEKIDTVFVSNIEHYLEILEIKYKIRKIYSASRNIDKNIAKSSSKEEINKEINDLVNLLNSNNFNNNNDNDDKLKLFRDGISSYSEVLENRYKDFQDGIRFTGLETGFKTLDEYTGGFQKGSFIVIGAKTSLGKSDLCLNIINNSLKKNKGIILYSLEMTYNEIMNRLISMQTCINNKYLRDGNLNKGNFLDIIQSYRLLNKNNFFINDSPYITIDKIEIQVEDTIKKTDIDLIVIDYLQLINPGKSNRMYNRTNEVGAISMGLKKLALKYQIPILVASQLSRQGSYRSDPVPILSDLRDSGNIEQDADVVIFIHKEVINDPNDPTKEKEINWYLKVAKCRNGETGIFEVIRKPEYSTFYE